MSEVDTRAKDLLRKLGNHQFEDPALREMVRANPVSVPIFTPRLVRYKYSVEVGIKDGDLIFHFFPWGESGDRSAFPVSDKSGLPFDDVIGDSFIKVFKFQEKLFAAYADELHSWAVKVDGYGKHHAATDLSAQVLDDIDARLKT